MQKLFEPSVVPSAATLPWLLLLSLPVGMAVLAGCGQKGPLKPALPVPAAAASAASGAAR